MAKILVVDDHPINRQFLVKLLGYVNHTVQEAVDGCQALTMVQADPPDLVISDIVMPNMDGPTFIKQMRLQSGLADTPVIFYTASYRVPDAKDIALDCNVTQIMHKPAKPEDILAAVNAALHASASPPQSASAILDAETLRLAALTELGLDLIKETDPTRLLRRFLQSVRYIIGAAGAGAVVTDGRAPKGGYAALVHKSADLAGPADPRAAAELIGKLVNWQPMMRLQSPAIDLAPLGLTEPIRTLTTAAIPFPDHATAAGWLFVFDKVEGAEFSREDERMIVMLANQLAITFENARLHADASLRAEELQEEIVERMRAEEAMHAAQQRLEHVVASSPALLFTLAIENGQVRGISWMSDNVLDMLGYPVSETHGTQWWMGHVHPDDLQSIIDITHRDLMGKGFTAHEYRFQHRDGGYRWVRSEIRVLRDAAGKPTEAVGSWSDITERKLLEEQYRQAQKMEAVGKLAGGVAHDFNNLLTVIMGYSDIYLDKLRPEDPLCLPLVEIRKAGERATALTRQLLAFSRKQVLMPVVLDLNAIIGDMEKMLHRLIGEDVALTVKAGANLWQVKADPGQMEQVVMNIVINARDAMPQGGKLLLETKNVELDARYAANHGEAKAGAHVLLAISDTGCGMDRSVKARIFEPFFTTKGPTKGTGLGLATVFGIIKQSGGHIEVYSEVGQGTTFKIYLPRDKSGQPIATTPRPKEAVRGGKETILLVEDEDGVRTLAETVLKLHGYKVLAARHGGDALLICENRPEPIDLMVTDVVMPHVSGRQLAERLATRQPAMKVLFMSGYTDDAIVHHGVLEAGTPFLQKPFAPDALIRKVRELLDAPPRNNPPA